MSCSLARGVALWWFVALGGCALSPRGIARDATPAAITAALGALNDQDNQRLVLQLLASPEMREAARSFAAEATDGALGALSEPARQERLERMSARYLAALSRVHTRALAAALRSELSPAIAAVVRLSVATALREALRAETRSDLDRLAREMVTELGHALVPALRDALLDARTAGELRAGARTLGREAVIGGNEAMTHIQRQQDRGARSSFLGEVSSLTTGGMRVLGLAAAAAVVLLVGWTLRLALWGRRLRAEVARQEPSAGGRCATGTARRPEP